MRLPENKIKQIEEYFIDKPVVNAFLFGSFSRAEANKNSDVDILVNLHYSQPIGLQFIQMKIDLEQILNRKVDLLSNESLNDDLSNYIKPDKTLIYERGRQR